PPGAAPALTETLATLWQPLVGYLVSILHSREEAEDVAQDTFARLSNHRAKLSAEGSVRGFVYRVARNLAISAILRASSSHRAAQALRDAADNCVPLEFNDALSRRLPSAI